MRTQQTHWNGNGRISLIVKNIVKSTMKYISSYFFITTSIKLTMIKEIEQLYIQKSKVFYARYHHKNKKVSNPCVKFSWRFSKELQKRKINHSFAIFDSHLAIFLDDYKLFIDLRHKKLVWPKVYKNDPFSLTPIKNFNWLQKYNEVGKLNLNYNYYMLMQYITMLEHIPNFKSLRVNAIVKLICTDKIIEAKKFLQYFPPSFRKDKAIAAKVIQKGEKNLSFRRKHYTTWYHKIFGNWIRRRDKMLYKKKCEKILYTYMKKHFHMKKKDIISIKKQRLTNT